MKLIDIPDLVEALLENERLLEINVRGNSMYPTIKGGGVARVVKCKLLDIKQGDIIVFKLNGKLIAHRFMRMVQSEGGSKLLAKGDNNVHYDPPFAEVDLVGRVEGLVIDGKLLKLNGMCDKMQRFMMIHFSGLTTTVNRKIFSVVARVHSAKLLWTKLKLGVLMVTESSRKGVVVNLLLSLLQGLLPFAFIVCIKWLIDGLTQTNASLYSNYALLVLTALVFLATGIASELKVFAGEKLSQKVIQAMYARVQSKHLSLQLSHFENPSELDKIHRAVQESTYRPVKFLNEIFTLTRSLAAAVFLAGLFFSIKWYLAAILVVAAIPSVLVRIKYARKFHKLKNTQSPAERKLYYFNRVLTALPFAKELKLFGFSHFFSSRFNGLQQELFSAKINLRRQEVTWNIVANIFTVLLIFVSLAIVLLLKMNGFISIGEVVLFFFAFQRGFSVLSDLFRSGALLIEDVGYLDDVRAFFELETAHEPSAEKMELADSIRFDKVSFSYEGSKREALKNISLTLPKGKTIAIVGANGSGKSTFIKLLCGFYFPSKGSIYFDTKTSNQIGQQAIAQNMAAVFQDFALYNVSAAQNIALGDASRPLNEADVVQAAKAAGIHDVLALLPQGYNTLLGNSFYGGEELSVGQWQKLAIARAFYRNADLLVLDEPSSALDVYAEEQIIRSIQQMTSDKTAIIISHRLTSVQWVDEIFVFEQGEIIEHGSHDCLMALQGHYFKLFQAAKKM